MKRLDSIRWFASDPLQANALARTKLAITMLLFVFFFPMSGSSQSSYPVLWQSTTGVTQNVGVLTKTATAGWGNAGANSSNLLRGGQDGWLEFQVPSTLNRYAIGFSTNIGGYGYQDLAYGVNPNEVGQYQLLESGSLIASGSYQAGDIFRISREASQIKYYKNGIVIRASTTSPDVQMIVKSVIYSGQSPAINSSVSPPPAEIDPIWMADKGIYYNLFNLQTPGQSQVHWSNITNVPSSLADGDNQSLAITGNQLSITGGNSVTLPSAWGILGNVSAGSNAFIGTTDDTDLVFKRSSVEAGRLSIRNTSFGLGALNSNTTGSSNTANGNQSLYSNTTGLYNTAIGNEALFSNTSGSQNTANGNESLSSNTTGAQNTAMGVDALRKNTVGSWNTATGARALTENNTGYNNTANGYESLKINTSGNSNTAVGNGSLRSNTIGSYNTANGDESLYSNTTGSYNSANGSGSLYTNTTGNFNSANGYGSLYSNTTGNNNSANGYGSLHSNTTGNYNTANGNGSLNSNTTGNFNSANGNDALHLNSTGGNNTANGDRALYSNTFGSDNLANGAMSLYNNTTGYGNTTNGSQSLFFNTYGSNNTASGMLALYINNTGYGNTGIGYSALAANTSGNFNTALGFNAGPISGLLDAVNSTAIGHNALVLSDNQVRIGDYNVTSIGGAVSWSTLSDGRFKRNIQEDIAGLEFIEKLRPVSYEIDQQKLQSFLKIEEKEKAVTQARVSQNPADQANQKVTPTSNKVKQTSLRTIGFVAQEVAQLIEEKGYMFSGVEKPTNESQDHYSIRYAEFVVPLTKAVQELSALVKAQQKEIEKLKGSISETSKSLPSSENKIEKIGETGDGIHTKGFELQQNAPNPFNQSTQIIVQLPDQVREARIIIYNLQGSELRSYALTERGKTSIEISAGQMQSGLYIYALVADGQLIDAKRMVLTR